MKANKWLALALVAVLALCALGLTGCGEQRDRHELGHGPAIGRGAHRLDQRRGLRHDGQHGSGVGRGVHGSENPGVMISVKGGGSGTGIAALINGTVDFADASREIKAEEIDRGQGQRRRPRSRPRSPRTASRSS